MNSKIWRFRLCLALVSDNAFFHIKVNIKNNTRMKSALGGRLKNMSQCIVLVKVFPMASLFIDSLSYFLIKKKGKKIIKEFYTTEKFC